MWQDRCMVSYYLQYFSIYIPICMYKLSYTTFTLAVWHGTVGQVALEGAFTRRALIQLT